MFFIVGVTQTCKRLAVCATEKQASEYIGSLPRAEEGIYYLDPVDAQCAPVVLAEVEIDDLPADPVGMIPPKF